MQHLYVSWLDCGDVLYEASCNMDPYNLLEQAHMEFPNICGPILITLERNIDDGPTLSHMQKK